MSCKLFNSNKNRANLLYCSLPRLFCGVPPQFCNVLRSTASYLIIIPLFLSPSVVYAKNQAPSQKQANDRESLEILSQPFQHIDKNNTENTQLPSNDKHHQSLNSWQTPDLWKRLRENFDLSGYEHQRVDTQLKWYAKHPKYLSRVTDRATPYLHYILSEVDKRGMPTEIALLPVVESAFQPFAFSAGRAAGMWQFIPATAKRYGLKINWWYEGRRDAVKSTQAALNYLMDLYNHFDNDWLLALAAYNTGQGNVDRAINRNIQKGKDTDFWSLDLPKETRDYVPKLLAIASLIAEPKAYGVNLPPIPDRPYFTQIKLNSQIDLVTAASMAEITVDELYALNSAFNRWATPPNDSHILLIPLGPSEIFKKKYALRNPKEQMQWRRHRIDEGETIDTLATKYHTSVDVLKKVNKLNKQTVQAGKNLLVPISSGKDAKHILIAATDTNNRKQRQHKIEHLVRKGDTFSDIANKYQVSVSDLALWNSMTPEDLLVTGKKLIVWATKVGKSLASTGFVSHINQTLTKRIIYKVRKGDSLAHIARRFNVSISQLQQWNELTDSSFLFPGQKISVTVDLKNQGHDI